MIATSPEPTMNTPKTPLVPTAPRNRNKYEVAFKLDAVRAAGASSLSVSKVARGLCIAPKTLLSWVAKFGGLATDGSMKWGEREQFERLKKHSRILEVEVKLLRKCGYLLKASHNKRFAFIDAHHDEFEVRTQCRVLDVSVSGYYAWTTRTASDHEISDGELTAQISEIFEGSHGRYGSPRVHAELIKKGVATSRKRVARLMRVNGLKATLPKPFKKTTLSDHDRGIAPNLLGREFEVTERDTVWVGDITYIHTDEGWVYLAVLVDLSSRLVVGWEASDHMRDELTLQAFRNAARRRGKLGKGDLKALLHHTDRGSQYASGDYVGELDRCGVTRSMSRRGDCWDNAVAESFFASLKKELVYRERFQTREEAYRSLFQYIEVFYNRERLHSTIGYTSPAEFERLSE